MRGPVIALGRAAGWLASAMLASACARPLPRDVRQVGPVGCAAPDIWFTERTRGEGRDQNGRIGALAIRCWRLMDAERRHPFPDITRPPLGGDRDACRAFARLTAGDYANHSDEKASPAKMRSLISRLCDEHDIEACTLLGDFLRSEGPERDLGEASRLLTAACAGGSERACLILGRNGRPDGKAMVWASCARGSVTACEETRLGGAALRCGDFACDSTPAALPNDYLCLWVDCRQRWVPPKDVSDAMTAVGIADHLLAPREKLGPNEPRDADELRLAREEQAAKEIESLVAKCEAGPAPRPCVILAHVSYESATYDAKYHRAALQSRTSSGWLERGCELGDGASCFLVGAPLVHADCPGIDQRRGLPLLERSCLLGDPYGCASLAALHDAGYGVPLDHARAASLRLRGRR